MKLCLAILLTSFFSIEAHGARMKRGLSADEQKKFLDVLNKDRNRVAQEEGFEYVPVKYDASLEKEIVSGKECLKYNHQYPLRLNDVAEKMRKIHMDGSTEGDIYQGYFHQDVDKIGCSKEAKCTQKLIKKDDEPPELEGKTIEYYGLCVLGSSGRGTNSDSKKLKKAKTPSPSKYADILGIPAGSGAGSIFSLTIYLFLVLYI